MESVPKIETFSPAKQELLKLESENLYVFHGTDKDTDELQPRLAIDNKTGPDGDPAIFGSTVAETAIFYAIMKAKNFKHGSVSSKEGSHGDSDTKTTYIFLISMTLLLVEKWLRNIPVWNLYNLYAA